MNVIEERKKEYWVAKNMMCISNKGLKISEKEVEKFMNKYEIINDITKYMPRGMSSIGAAVGKCAIKYDQERAIQFLQHAKEGIFEGREDPVYHFYMWLKGVAGPKRKKNDISTYEVALYACKNYCLKKKIKGLRRSKDIFQWSENWSVK